MKNFHWNVYSEKEDSFNILQKTGHHVFTLSVEFVYFPNSGSINISLSKFYQPTISKKGKNVSSKKTL